IVCSIIMSQRSFRRESPTVVGTSSFRRSQTRPQSRGRPTHRHRRLFLESLEDRSLLAAIAKFDFDSLPNETGPSGWTHVIPATAPNGVVDPSGIGVRFFGSAPIGVAGSYNTATVPNDATGIQKGLARPLSSD